MKTAIEVDRFRRTKLSASPGEYDGSPQIADRFVDLVPQRMNRFRASLASVLPFLGSINGAVETSTPFYPLTASLLREYASPLEALASNIEWAPTDIAGGSGTLIVRMSDSTSLSKIGSAAVASSDVAELLLVRSDIFSGYLSTTHGAVAGSNAWLVEALDGAEARFLTMAAFGVLFAEDFDARIVGIECDAEPNLLEELERIFESVGLQLIVNVRR